MQRRIQVDVEVKVEVEMERTTQVPMQVNTQRAMLPPILPDVLLRILRETRPIESLTSKAVTGRLVGRPSCGRAQAKGDDAEEALRKDKLE